MWTATLDLSPRRVLLTQLLGRFWRGAYLSSFAPLRVENTPRQQLPGTRWVRVRNRLAGICGSDLHLIAVDGDLRVAPAALPSHSRTYLGHEVVGEVIEVGDDVQQVQIGDRVALQHGMNCLAADVPDPCRSCSNGNFSLCEYGNLPGPYPVGGGWSEEMLLHEQQLFRIPLDMTDEQAVLLEPTSVAVHTVLRRVPEAGERVLIVGAGTIGLLTLQVVRALSPDAEISVLARYPFQVEKATRMGASHIIYPQDSFREVQRVTQAQMYNGILGNRMLLGGYDVIYDTVGNRSTIHNALRWTRAKGTVVLVGLNLHFMNIDLSPVWYQEINLLGTMGQGMELWPLNTCEQCSTFDIATDLIMQEKLHPEQLITHRFALSNYRVALQTAMAKQQGRAIKVVFDYSMQPASVVPNVRASASTRLKNHITTTLAPNSTNSSPEREVAPVSASYQPVPSSMTPILPVEPVSSMASASSATSAVPASYASAHEQPVPVVPTTPSSSNEEDDDATVRFRRPSWEIRPTIGIAPPMPVTPVHIETMEAEPAEDEYTTLPVALHNEYQKYDIESDTSTQNGYYQDVQEFQSLEAEPELQAEDETQSEPQEESFYTFYTPEEDETGAVEPLDFPFTESEVAIDISTDTPIDIPDDNPSEQPEQEMDEEISTSPSVEGRFIAPSNNDQPDDDYTEAQQAEQEQSASTKQPTTTKAGNDKGHSRSKRRKKTHSLVLPTKPDDTNSMN